MIEAYWGALWPASLVLSVALTGTGSHGRTQGEPAPIRLTWIGHAGFEIVSPGGTRVLIDPWISGNSAVPAAYADTTRYAAPATRPAVILVTHPHSDHAGDVPTLARVSGAQVVATGDHLQQMKIPEERYLSINIGGVQKVGDVEIHAVPAMHSVERPFCCSLPAAGAPARIRQRRPSWLERTSVLES